MYGQNFTLPERTVNYEDLQYRAYKIPVPTTLDMTQDHSMTVYADVRGDLRRALLDWQAACINPDISHGSYFESNRRPTRLGFNTNTGDNGFEPSIVVRLLAPDYQTPIEQTKIYGSRVMKVGGLELSNISGSISTFSVDFKSVYWEQRSFATGGGGYNKEERRYTNLGGNGHIGDTELATSDSFGNAENLSSQYAQGKDYGTAGGWVKGTSLT